MRQKEKGVAGMKAFLLFAFFLSPSIMRGLSGMRRFWQESGARGAPAEASPIK
jgi:hypothetical protein